MSVFTGSVHHWGGIYYINAATGENSEAIKIRKFRKSYDVNMQYYEAMENAEHFTYNRAWDGHGGHGEEHHWEIWKIAEMVADQKIAAIVLQM